jgi:hypothetical protein
MSYIITDKNEVFVDFRQAGTPEWSSRPDIEHVARQFITKEEAVSVTDELRALGLNPKLVNWDRRAKKHTVIPFKREVATA